ncbi:IS66 family insertion sequence element accessory protein TnpB [Vibrio owensii]|uniref:IS66 family insertion sequence element accessory protein TnpB n=1 Tax=Vibrio owensii TaxID=696485 RepID=UPI003D9FF12C
MIASFISPPLSRLRGSLNCFERSPVDVTDIYLHKAPVDFRKGINGLSLSVEQHMNLNPFSEVLFVFCNRTRDKLESTLLATQRLLPLAEAA